MRDLVWRDLVCSRCKLAYRESDAFTVRTHDHLPLCVECLKSQAMLAAMLDRESP